MSPTSRSPFPSPVLLLTVVTLVTVVAGAVCPIRAGAQVEPVGKEFKIGRGEFFPDVAMDARGRFLVAWADEDGTAWAKVYDRDARAVAGRFRVAHAGVPRLAADGRGETLFVWHEEHYDPDVDRVRNELVSRSYDVLGAPLGARRRIDREPLWFKVWPAVTRNRSGGTMVLWRSVLQRGCCQTEVVIRGQRFKASGRTMGRPLDLVAGDHTLCCRPAVAMEGAGRFVAAWRLDGIRLEPDAIFFQRYRRNATRRGKLVEVARGRRLGDPRVAMHPDGDFVVTWYQDTERFEADVMARWFDAFGRPSGEAVRVTRLQGAAETPIVEMDRFGNTVLVWWENFSQTSSDGRAVIAGQVFDAAGDLVGGPFPIAEGRLGWPAMDIDEAGRFIVVWSSFPENVIRARRFRLACAPGYEQQCRD